LELEEEEEEEDEDEELVEVEEEEVEEVGRCLAEVKIAEQFSLKFKEEISKESSLSLKCKEHQGAIK
jgi:hypothetical protein